MPMPDEAIDAGLTPSKWRVLVDAVFPSAKSEAAVMLAIDYCKARGLDIFKRPVHIVPMYSTVLKKKVETVWPGINEVQITASRTGAWAGMDPPKWGPDRCETFYGKPSDDDEDGGRGSRQQEEVEVHFPEWCEVTVYKIVQGQRFPFTERVYWLETYATAGPWTEIPNKMWQKRVRGQLHKCAKAAALRAAFPECSDYVAEEMEGKVIGPDISDRGGAVIDGHSEHVGGGQAAGEPERPKPGHRVFDEFGNVWSTCTSLNEAFISYAKAKGAATDKGMCAARNLELLRRGLETAKNGQRDKLEKEIAAAEAVKEQADLLDQDAGKPILGDQEPG
jgi:phage recombination protein Bet